MGRLSQLHDMEEHMHTINHGPDNVLDITLNGEVTTEDYDSLVPRLEDEIETHDEIRVLWDMSEMDGVEAPCGKISNSTSTTVPTTGASRSWGMNAGTTGPRSYSNPSPKARCATSTSRNDRSGKRRGRNWGEEKVRGTKAT